MEKSEGKDMNMEEKVEVITDAQPISWRPPEDFVPFVDGQSFGLPEGWMVERRPRTNPNYIGKFDQYYYVPGTKIKFRSLKNAQNYVKELEAKQNNNVQHGEQSENKPAETKSRKEIIRDIKEHLRALNEPPRTEASHKKAAGNSSERSPKRKRASGAEFDS